MHELLYAIQGYWSKIQLDYEQNIEKIGKKKKEFLERKIGGKKVK